MKGTARSPANGQPKRGPRQKKKVAKRVFRAPQVDEEARGRKYEYPSIVVSIVKVEGKKAIRKVSFSEQLAFSLNRTGSGGLAYHLLRPTSHNFRGA
jgi:hypothetical protein